MFQHDLETIDALRRDAVNVREPHLSGIKKLQVYAGQLAWIGGKFPIDVRKYPLTTPLGRLL
jgi:programmed cell death 6-interacting protein